MRKARTVKTSKKRKLTGKGFKDVAKKVAKVAIPIALAVAGAVAAKKLYAGRQTGKAYFPPTALEATYLHDVSERYPELPKAAEAEHQYDITRRYTQLPTAKESPF